MRAILICGCVLFICTTHLFAQVNSNDSTDIANTNDSIRKAQAARKKLYSAPRKATLMSAILPGLGQAYNKQFWKIPIIYGGIGGFTYMFITNNNQYKFFRKNVIAAYDNDPNTINTSGYSDDNAQIEKLRYKKLRDFAAIGIGFIYLLNIIDANVSAHLKTFDVSDDLSLRITPWQNSYHIYQQNYGMATGLSIQLNFK
jgi:hypothetical protein